MNYVKYGLIAYIICGFLTYGIIYNQMTNVDCGLRPNIIKEPIAYDWWSDCTSQKRMARPEAIFKGFFWLPYTIGNGAILLTRSLTTS